MIFCNLAKSGNMTLLKLELDFGKERQKTEDYGKNGDVFYPTMEINK